MTSIHQNNEAKAHGSHWNDVGPFNHLIPLTAHMDVYEKSTFEDVTMCLDLYSNGIF